MIKEAFIEAADSLFQDFKNKLEILSSINDLKLSRSTVTQRCEVMAEDLTQQFRRDMHTASVSLCNQMSLQTPAIQPSCAFLFGWSLKILLKKRSY